MPRIESRSLVWAFAASVGFWVLLGQGHSADAYSSYRGLWETRENDQGIIVQRYDNLFSFNLDQGLSERLNSRENVNYGYKWEEDVGKREVVSPGASLSVSGDLFLANLAVNSVRNLDSNSQQPDSDSLGILWTSSWHKRYVPELRFNYDNAQYKTKMSDRETDEIRKDIGGEVKWDLQLLQALYSYRRDDSKYTSYQTIQDSQMLRVNTGGSWLDNRLRVSMGHEYNESHAENVISFATSTTTSIPITLSSPYTGIESSPDNPTVIDSLAGPVTALVNNDLLVSAYSVPVGSNNCIRLQNNTGKPVYRLYLYTQENLGFNPSGLTWRLLFNNGDYTVNPWSQVSGVSVSYDVVNQRFVMVVPDISPVPNNLKVVVDRGFISQNLNITEVKAEQILQGNVGSTKSLVSDNKSNKSNFSFDFTLNKSVAFYYNYLRASEDTDSITTNENTSHNGGTRLQNSAGDLSANISYSLSNRRYQDGPEAQTQTYLVGINKVFLPTLSVSLTGSHDTSAQGGVSISDRNRYSLYADAKLYPDLTSRVEIIYWEQESYHPGLASDLWDNLRSQFSLTSRFRPSLVVSFDDTYEIQNQDGKSFDKKNSASITGSWQLSDWCSFSGTMQKENSQRANDVYLYSLSTVVGLGAGLEWKASYSLQDSDGTSQSGATSLRWSSNKNVSLEVGCDYAETSANRIQNLYKVYSKLVVSFATQ